MEGSLCSSSSTTIGPYYKENGFVGPIDVLKEAEAKQALDEVSSELRVVDPHVPLVLRGDERFKLHLILRSIDFIAHHPTIVAAVQEALQTKDVFLWSSDINWKPPQSEGFFAPHQDSTYAGLSPSSRCVTAWVALSDPVGEMEGCLSFYQRSHTLGQLPHEQNAKGRFSNNMLSLGQFIAPSELKSMDPPVPIPLRAGQITLHSFLTVHTSGPNRSMSGPRVGLALRYFDASTVVQTKAVYREMVTEISSSGSSSSHRPLQFDLEPRLPNNPSKEDVERMREVRAKAMRRENANYFR